MRNDRHLAEELRRKGHNYNYIASELGMAKSTLSTWFGGRPWSEKVRNRLDRTNRDLSGKRARTLAESQKAKWEAWREGRPDLHNERELDFWSRRVGLSLSQFRKSQVIQSRNFRGLHPSKRLEHGICLVTVCSRGLKEQMWIWQTLCYQRLLSLHLRV